MKIHIPYTDLYFENNKVYTGDHILMNPPYTIYYKEHKKGRLKKTTKDIEFLRMLIDQPLHDAETFWFRFKILEVDNIKYWKQPVNGIESPEHKDFYVIPNYSKYCINKKATIRNRKTGRELKQSTSTWGYRKLLLSPDILTRAFDTVKIHRIMLMTFTDWNVKHIKELTVDHLDTNRANNDLDNLKWMSIQDNLKLRDERRREKETE